MLKVLIITFSALLVFTGKIKTEENQAILYLIRSTGSPGSLERFNVFMDDSLLCRISNNKYTVHYVKPGLHEFQVRFGGKKPKKRFSTLDIEMEAGQEYYINLDLTNHALISSLFLVEVTANSGKKLILPLENGNCK